jgi:hypothetical protein
MLPFSIMRRELLRGDLMERGVPVLVDKVAWTEDEDVEGVIRIEEAEEVGETEVGDEVDGTDLMQVAMIVDRVALVVEIDGSCAVCKMISRLAMLWESRLVFHQSSLHSSHLSFLLL